MVSIPIVRPSGAGSQLHISRAGRAPPSPATCQRPAASRRVCRASQPAAGIRSRTRIKPPGDVIKLADRLHTSCSRRWSRCWPKARWRFPVRPFPFQFEGVAFLYPRQAAILADEMGLGKTMQAITAIRLLLRRGEVRSVLLVCPKPLVTNWQREFALWAPEVPVMVVEGDQAKRGWQWSLARRAAAHRQLRTAAARSRAAGRTGISTWSCSTNRSGSRTAPAPPARSSARSPAGAVGP